MHYSKLLKDKWYKMTWGNKIKYTWYFKFEKILDNTYLFAYNYYIDYSRKKYQYLEYVNNLMIVAEDDYFVECNISEIVDYLPNDNPDKIFYLRKKKLNMLLCNS